VTGLSPRSSNGEAKAPVSPWPHALGFVLAIAGCVLLADRFHRDPTKLAIMSVYGGGLVIAFGVSTLYHWLGGTGPRRYAVFRRLDHAAIYLLMAGSYTPVLFFGLSGAWRIDTLAFVWLLAGVGIICALFFPHAPRALSTSLYLGLGWLAVVPAVKLVATLSHLAIALILIGGLLYSAGGIVYVTRSFDFAPRRFGFHEVFHIFVVCAAAVHFAAIAFTLTAA
jgi:hemolysin III